MEEWRDIVGYEGLYKISNVGNVMNNKGRILKLMLTNGYPTVNLYKNRKMRSLSVHRLVAEAFIPNPMSLPIVNHKDENKVNNSVDNLEWCTKQYNTTYSIGKKILQIDERGNVVKEWNSATEIAKAFEIQRQVILGCCYNNTGFDWKFKEDNNKN